MKGACLLLLLFLFLFARTLPFTIGLGIVVGYWKASGTPIQVTSFIGREREIADVKRLLATSHLLTLTGAGGCGKTRLAFQVAADAASAYPDGVWLAELAALTDPGLVPQAVASAVGVREAPGFSVTDTLVDYLRSRTLLLVLDNCEHVVGNAAQLVDALLRRCSGVRILATSREPLARAVARRATAAHCGRALAGAAA